MTQAYDKDGNKIPFALYKGDYVERDFQTVEQLQSTIASQAAEIKELKNRLSVLDDFRVASQNKLIAAHEQHCEQMRAQIERLREAAEKALHILQYCPDKQEKAVALLSAALQPKEGK